MEKIVKPISGILGFIIILLVLAASVFFFLQIRENEVNPFTIVTAVLLLIISLFLMKGLMIIQPNHSRVLNFFGKYAGTVKDNGWWFVNPFYTTENISLRAQNLESAKLKVNDKMGNPIEIAAVIVWEVGETYKAAYDVVNYKEYVLRQSEAAVRHLANSFPYDNLEDPVADITLR
ncbi:MAG: SPFH domain-containing protein, partial [Flavisolibacter sp.]